MLSLAALGLLLMITIAARMYAPSPLDEGRLLHSTHHDWVYLVSRAAEIKTHWPLEDPSLAGTPLSYHYFLMAHVAAASQVTGLEISLVMLRLAALPMGAALLMQAFVLGRLLANSARAGVLAASLLLVAGEVSGSDAASGGVFQSLFVSWLFISPTFHLGMIFMGALMIWMHRIIEGVPRPIDYAVFFLLAVAGTGAKGTTVGPLAAAAALWCVWQVATGRGWPVRMAVCGGLLFAGFLTAYVGFLRGYSGNGTQLSLFAFPSVAPFWLEHVDGWRAWLATQGFSEWLSANLAGAVGAAVVALGMNGVLFAGLWHAYRVGRRPGGVFVAWLGLVAIACLAFGNVLFLDSHGESYLYLPMKFPLAVLAAAGASLFLQQRLSSEGLTENQRRTLVRFSALVGTGIVIFGLTMAGVFTWGIALVAGGTALFVLAPARGESFVAGMSARGSGRTLFRLLPLFPAIGVLTVQISFFASANRSGIALWRATAAAGREEGLVELHEALDWVRRNTPQDALLVATTFRAEFATPDAARTVDRTAADKHYYYSALAERRLYIEGPAYVRDQGEAAVRLHAVSRIMEGQMPMPSPDRSRRSVYLLVDHAALTDVHALPPAAKAVFENQRISLYRISGI